jgi:hypothetical protein
LLYLSLACFISTSTTSEKLPVHRFRCFFLQSLALSQPPVHRKSFLLTYSDAFSSSRLLYLDLHYIGKASCSPIPMLFPPAACFISAFRTSEVLPAHRFRCFFLQPLALSQPPLHRKSFLSTDSDAFPPAACFISASTTSESFLLTVSDAFSSSRLPYLDLHYIGKVSLHSFMPYSQKGTCLPSAFLLSSANT